MSKKGHHIFISKLLKKWAMNKEMIAQIFCETPLKKFLAMPLPSLTPYSSYCAPDLDSLFTNI